MPSDAVTKTKGPDKLAHSLQPRHVALISFGGVIGAGLFVGSAGALHVGGPGVIVTYTICGLLVFLIMRMLGEMAVADPGQGSFVEYSALGLGRWAGFVTGWLYWYFWVFTVGAETVAGSKLLIASGLNLPIWLIGGALVAIMTFVNTLSVKSYGEVEFWFALVKVVAIVVFIVVGSVYVLGLHPGQAVHNLIGQGGLFPMGGTGLMAAVPIVIFSMMGSEIACIAAAESADPAGNVARAARTVALRILAFYVLSVVVIAAILPWGVIKTGLSPFKAAADVIGIPGTATIMSIIIITAVLSCLNSGLYICSRMLYELACAGHAPRSLCDVGESKVPRLGILIGCVAGFLAALGQIYMREDVFTILGDTSGDITLFVYAIIAFAQIRRRRLFEVRGRPLPLKMWLFPGLSYAVIAGIAIVLVVLAFIPGERLTLLASCGTVVMVLGTLWLGTHQGWFRSSDGLIIQSTSVQVDWAPESPGSLKRSRRSPQ